MERLKERKRVMVKLFMLIILHEFSYLKRYDINFLNQNGLAIVLTNNRLWFLGYAHIKQTLKDTRGQTESQYNI